MGTVHSSPLSTQPPAGETLRHNAPTTGALNFAKASTVPKPRAPAPPAPPTATPGQAGGRRNKNKTNKNKKNKTNKRAKK